MCSSMFWKTIALTLVFSGVGRPALARFQAIASAFSIGSRNAPSAGALPSEVSGMCGVMTLTTQDTADVPVLSVRPSPAPLMRVPKLPAYFVASTSAMHGVELTMQVIDDRA